MLRIAAKGTCQVNSSEMTLAVTGNDENAGGASSDDTKSPPVCQRPEDLKRNYLGYISRTPSVSNAGMRQAQIRTQVDFVAKFMGRSFGGSEFYRLSKSEASI